MLFSIYINDLSDGLKSECKLFTDDTSLFSVVNGINTSASDLNEDLEKIDNWAFKWKMTFNPDPNKQTQEIVFSRKKTATLLPVVYFVKLTQIHKHLGMMLDPNLRYEHHIKSILNKVHQTISLLRKFQLILPRHFLITIYKIFIRPHLDYTDVCVCISFHRNSFSRLEQNNKCNARDHTSNYVLRKLLCVKYLRRNVINNQSRDLQASNCERGSIKPGRSTRSKRQLLKLSKNQQ